MGKHMTTGLLIGGSLRQSGITFYVKGGKVVARSAHSEERRSNTRGQFVSRQRMRHTTALWQSMKPAHPLFEGEGSGYTRFASLANHLPAVFVPRRLATAGAALLLPGMPVSEGSLPPMTTSLGTVDGMVALLTNLVPADLKPTDRLRLYTLRQTISDDTPYLLCDSREVARADFELSGGHLALVGEEYGDPMGGWALVRCREGRCSTQTAVSRCTVYQDYTTDEALLSAAATYGGLTA